MQQDGKHRFTAVYLSGWRNNQISMWMTQTKTSADRGSTPLESTTFAGVTQLVEYLGANQIVVGSSPITRLN